MKMRSGICKILSTSNKIKIYTITGNISTLLVTDTHVEPLRSLSSTTNTHPHTIKGACLVNYIFLE